MLSLNELAEEYKSNAQELQKQIDSIELTVEFCHIENEESNKLWRKKRMLEEMLFEQMAIYNKLKNYYGD